MSSSPREIGTLIVVVLRAKNLPNKRHIGKQDPYCRMSFNQETRRTKAVKRGGQHPEWDEEVRFSIYEDAEDELARTAGDKTPPPKERFRNIKGGKSMRVSCYADDPREPDLIGETQVDLTEALTKGEVDEWFTLQNKDKYAGEVYLEMTFWSNAKPPAKKKAPRPSTGNPQYGGPGSFTPSTSASASTAPPPANSPNEIPAFLRPNRETSPAASVPDSLKPSNSALGKPDLYISPYNSQNSLASQNSLPSALEPAGPPYDDFGRMGQNPNHRRDSYPPARYDQPSSLFGHSNGSIPQQGYQQPSYDLFSSSSLTQSMSNMHIGQPPTPSTFPPPTPAPSFVPSQFGYGVPQDNVQPPFPQGPSYPGLGYGPPSATPMPSNGAFQPGFPPQNQGNRLASSGFAAPPPIPTPMPFNVPPPVTPFQQPPIPSHTPFPQQHPYQPQQYPPNPTPAPPPQNGPPSWTIHPFCAPNCASSTRHVPSTAGSSSSVDISASRSTPACSSATVQCTSAPINASASAATAAVSASATTLLSPATPDPAPSTVADTYLIRLVSPIAYPLNKAKALRVQVHSVPFLGPFLRPHQTQTGRNGSHPRLCAIIPTHHPPPSLPGPPPPLPSQPHPPQLSTSPVQQTQSPPPNHFQAPPPPPSSSFQSYQNNAETQLPPPPSAYQQPPPHPQQQRQSIPVGGIFPGPSTTTIYPGPPPKPPQMVAPQHNGWQ
ncbi:hypothetical protein OPQ81_009538 [Rhizoctonia solani]|nr:hypothetical protein OPQ81_009538 [Rhizoctonia solani]